MQGLTPPVRLAFVGDSQRFGAWALRAPVGGLEPLFVAVPGGEARRTLEAFRPHVVVVFDVEAVPHDVYAGIGVPVLGVAAPDEDGYDAALPPLPAKLPRPPVRTRAELLLLRVLRRLAPARMQPRLAAADAFRRAALPAPSAAPWDRLVALDPRAARGRDLWRLIAPPVDDALFAPPRTVTGRAQVTVAAPSTPYRERLLLDAKHAHDIRHVAHGLTPAALVGDIDVAVVLRPTEDAGFQHGVALHAAAGHLVICDHAGHGLEAGTDVVLAENPKALTHAVGTVRTAPGVHHSVRVRGRLKAERFRASTVWRDLVDDLRADLDAFG